MLNQSYYFDSSPLEDRRSMYYRVPPTMAERQRYAQALREQQMLEEQRYRRQEAERRRMLDERRRAEEEMYIRRQQYARQQEQERMAAILRAKRAREQQQQEIVRRQRLAALAAAEKRKAAAEDALRQQKKKQEESGSEELIVRGRDGRLYRVRRPGGGEAKQATPAPSYRAPESDNDSFHSAVQSEQSTETEVADNRKSTRRIPDSKASTSLSGVLVEDASDSEDEDDYYRRSVWNNRRPSPGLLMEPVEAM